MDIGSDQDARQWGRRDDEVCEPTTAGEMPEVIFPETFSVM